jgi:hypothetical protein
MSDLRYRSPRRHGQGDRGPTVAGRPEIGTTLEPNLGSDAPANTGVDVSNEAPTISQAQD